MSKEDFDKTRAYSLDKSYFGFVQSIVLHAIGIWILYADILPLVWKYSLQFSSQWPIFAKYSEESEVCSFLYILYSKHIDCSFFDVCRAILCLESANWFALFFIFNVCD